MQNITTKVWHTELAPDAIQRSFDTSLAKLKLDYVDLFLVHWPSKGMDLHAMFETLMRLREEDRRAIASLRKNQRLVQPPFAPQWD